MIIYAPDAERDVERLHTWYFDRSTVAAEAFMARLALAELRIEMRPKAYRLLTDRETRRFSFRINRTSYLSTTRSSRLKSLSSASGTVGRTGPSDPPH